MTKRLGARQTMRRSCGAAACVLSTLHGVAPEESLDSPHFWFAADLQARVGVRLPLDEDPALDRGGLHRADLG